MEKGTVRLSFSAFNVAKEVRQTAEVLREIMGE
jgi:selenocysteine lyase/cysteine desulfurase